ncbi:ATP-binding protein [Aquabacterium sp. OR-4]|uniref:ATP-binding protein n=1 Tax=Aquabacterium sp. OR-4 TaxID=2978127 RepID=UPI0028C9BDDF|nr:AAA family ATPase [Aquabacterium sp. OR-4]MDT7836123.1 AAA family ATPase [Aquabacterium sp. OR-4]
MNHDTAPAAGYPFTALVGQAALQQALLLAAVDPAIGGVLISGPRGTAKSTAARALAPLLPGPAPGRAAPFVELPLAATLEQLVGTLDVDEALRENRLRFRPGLLARADGGVLYVDEVNLLPDALVDALLDAAASGVHTVERDGLSQRHASRLVLVGTMNPEEGALRPQLLDRFGLAVHLANPADAAARLAIVQARLSYEADPAAAQAQHAAAQHQLASAVAAARQRLPTLAWPAEVLQHATRLAHAAQVDGLRADLVMLRAARARAALQQCASVSVQDVDAVAALALAHRRGEGAAPLPASAPPAAGAHPPGAAGSPGPASAATSGAAPSPAPGAAAGSAAASAAAGSAAGSAAASAPASAAASGAVQGRPPQAWPGAAGVASSDAHWGAMPPRATGLADPGPLGRLLAAGTAGPKA